MVDAFVFERRVLLGCTGMIGAAIILWIIAISTDHWITVSGGDGMYANILRFRVDHIKPNDVIFFLIRIIIDTRFPVQGVFYYRNAYSYFLARKSDLIC